MTKAFNTVQELWNYCLFCPICQDNCREIAVSVGPDPVFELIESNKDGSHLQLKCEYTKFRNTYIVSYKICCIDNTFEVKVEESFIKELPKFTDSQIEKVYFYCYFYGHCLRCKNSTVDSTDLEFDLVSKKITNIGLERESFYLLKTKDQFHTSLIYDREVMLVSRCNWRDGSDITAEGTSISLPLVTLDLSNQEKAVSKIKTLILFS